jgi:hypothetical protein
MIYRSDYIDSVTDEYGNALADRTVELTDKDGTTIRHTTNTDVNGNFTISNVRQGEYDIYVDGEKIKTIYHVVSDLIVKKHSKSPHAHSAIAFYLQLDSEIPYYDDTGTDTTYEKYTVQYWDESGGIYREWNGIRAKEWTEGETLSFKLADDGFFNSNYSAYGDMSGLTADQVLERFMVLRETGA